MTTTPGDGTLATSDTPPAAAPAVMAWPGYVKASVVWHLAAGAAAASASEGFVCATMTAIRQP